MLSRTANSGNKHGVKRALSIMLSSVLAITLLQIAPPAKATESPQSEPLNVYLIARYEDTNGVAASLAGSTITGADSATSYRLDLSLSCGALEPGPLVSNVSSPADNALVGLAEDLERQLNVLRIIRTQGPNEWDMPVDCSSSSRITAYLSPVDGWTEVTDSTIPQGSSNFFIGSGYPFPTLTTFDSENNFLTLPSTNIFSNGFEIEWDQFNGAAGYTPAGYSLRYREVFDGQTQRGPWIYQKSDDGRLKSLVVQDPVVQGQGPAFQYEVEIAPSFIDCDSYVHFGKFESVIFVNGVGFASQFGLSNDPSLLTPNNPQMIAGEVVSQCSDPNTDSNPPVITTTSLADGIFGATYEQTIELATQGTFSFEVTGDGQLPNGLSLNSVTGVISGTPTDHGEQVFTVKVTDSVSDAFSTQELSIIVYAAGPVGCKDYSNASYVPDHFLLDSNGYPIGCDVTGQNSVTPEIADDPETVDVIESWTNKFDNQANLDFFNLRNGYKCDDCFVGKDGVEGSQGFPLGFEIDYYGETYDSVFVNSNGSISFSAGADCYDEPLVDIMKCDDNSTSAVVAYGVDLDNSDIEPGKFLENPATRHSDFFYWGKTTVEGKEAFVATWINSPGYCSNTSSHDTSFFEPSDFNVDVCNDWDFEDTLSTFQIVLIDQSTSEETSGDADVVINYGSMLDSKNGYSDCGESCDESDPRFLAAGLGKASAIPGEPITWEYSITSLSGLAGSPPVQTLYNGLSAIEAADGGAFPISGAIQSEGSTPGRFVYQFRANVSPNVAAAPGEPTVTLESESFSNVTILISPPTEQGGAPVTRYQVRYRVFGATDSWTTVTSNLQSADQDSSYTLGQLQENQTYEIQVAADNGIGVSDYSDSISVTTLDAYRTNVDMGVFGWSGVGSGIENVEVQIPEGDVERLQVLGSGSMRAYWIPNINANPLTQGIEISCANEVDAQIAYNTSSAEMTCPTFDLSAVQPGLTAQITRQFAASDPWHQISVKLFNSDEADSISGAIAYRLDLESGANTDIAMTSDGDLDLDNSDKWFVTRDSTNGSRPVSLHYFGDVNGRVSQDNPELNPGKFWIKKPFTLTAASNQTHRFIDGFTDLTANAAGSDSGQAVVVAMKAADQLEHQTWDGASDVLTKDITEITSNDQDLPVLRIQYDCRDFGRNVIYPVVVQNDGQPIGCNIGLSENNGFSEGDGPGSSSPLDAGLYPSLEDEEYKKADWIQRFRYTFPNATPRLGWACDACAITSEGPEATQDEENQELLELGSGLPLGFTTSIDEKAGLDRIRILPQGVVQLHASNNLGFSDGVVVAAFGNLSLGNETLQGPWDQLPEYDFFYWGRTEYQGRLAFVVTWVKIPTLNNETIREPIDGSPSTMQLMIVSDSSPSTLGDYFDFPEDRVNSNVDIIWNFDSLQSQGAQGLATIQDGDTGARPLYSGFVSLVQGNIPLVSDAFIDGDQSAIVGIGNESNDSSSCNSDCVVENLLTNRLQSPVDGRYVLGYRTYELIEPVDGILAPAAPRDVEVSRSSGDSATISWSKPIPWVLSSYQAPEGTEPVYGYRIEYAVNTRGENTGCNGDGPGPTGCFTTYPQLNADPLFADSDGVTVTGSGTDERLSFTIPDLSEKENYTFRVFAVYSGLDFPEDETESAPTDMIFGQEVRSTPATANEFHDSSLQIITVATDTDSMLDSAQEIAGLIAGNLEVTNATVNGSPYAYGQTAKSIAGFFGGENSIGFDEGIVLSPLTDARTFQRGSGITATGSSGEAPTYFADPNHRAKYFESANEFSDFLSTQESWIPEEGFAAIFDCEDAPDCANGTTILQFDIEKPVDNDFLKFEYALAGLETTSTDGPSDTAEVYDYPDGFGLFIGGINQESSCALVPQIDDETNAQRFMSMGNALNARLASEVSFNSDLNAETVSSVMSCNFDVSEIVSETITITMAIANANDAVLSTAVFIKSNSLRFEPTSINSIDIPSVTQGEGYEPLQFTATGTVPARWSATGLPDGMTVNSEGQLQGTPEEFGSFDFILNAIGSQDELLASQTFTILVNQAFTGNEPENDRFLQGTYVEVGIGGNGHFGSTGPAPDEYHPRDRGDGPPSNRLGFVSDREKNGWGIGQDDGDFFVPGTPFEGFGIDVGGTSYFNNHSDTDIRRLSEDTNVTSNLAQSTWVSEVMTNGLQVTQVAAVPVNDQRLDVTVTLANTSDTDLADVYYARQVDNDANVYACEESDSGWNSLNTVVAQADSADGVSLVSSIMMDDCNDGERPTDLSAPHSYLGMISTDPNSVAALQGYNDFDPQQAIDFVNGVSDDECAAREGQNENIGCLPVMVARGSQVFGDAGIGLGFDLGTIPAGQETTVTFTYILSPAQAQEIIEAHAVDNNIEAPVLTSDGASFSANVNQSFTSGGQSWFTVTGGDISYFSVSPALPEGLSLNLSTGEILGTPTESIELAEFTLTAHNLAGTSSVDFILEVNGVEQLTCESVGGASQNENPELNVLLLSKYVDNPEPEQNQTDPASDSAIARILCNHRNPVAIATTFFNGGDGSESAWGTALQDVDVLVLPETDGPLLGSDLLSQEAMNYLENWVQSGGGRIVMAGASRYVNELENLISAQQGTLSTENFEGEFTDRYDGARALDQSLPIESDESSMEDWDRSQWLLKIDENFWASVNSNDISVSNLYGGWQNDSFVSAAILFEIGRGQATYLSSNFEGSANSPWNEVFLQSIYGTAENGFSITESGKNWYLTGTGAYWSEMQPGARFEVGSSLDLTPVTCMNTPTNPAVRDVSQDGTQITCGSQLIQDGQIDAGVSVRLTRFVTASGDWMSSEVAITNLDQTDTYSENLWFGGSQGIGSSMAIEATSSSSAGSANLISESNGSDEVSNWIVSSGGAEIDDSHGGYNSEIISRFFFTAPSANYGGPQRYESPRLFDDEIKSNWAFEIAPTETFLVTAVIGRTTYEPGCDRTAVEVSKRAVQEFLSMDGPGEIPSLAVDCQAFASTVSEVQAIDMGGFVNVSWDRMEQADRFEISHQLEGADAWSDPVEVSAVNSERVSHRFNGLSVGQTYRFRIRPVEVDRNEYLDTAKGPWSQSGLLTVSSVPTPSSSPTQSSPPPNNSASAPAPAQVIPQMIAQTGPGFPARLKKGKTVKFGMTAPSGLPLRVTTVGKCKTTAITKKVTVKVLVGKKIKKKKVKMQTGWAVKGSKKGTCTITFSNSGDATRSPLASAGTITVF